jgi:hypothetical protein|nr:hypothetical protein [Kofleriaceae bacterium]
MRVLLSLLAVSGCAVVDVGETCMTYSDIQVPAMPTGATSLATSFSLDDLGPFSSLAGDGFTLSFTRAEVRTTSGIDNFGFVRDATVKVASNNPQSTLPTVEVLGCDDCTIGSDTAELEVAGASTIAAAPYVESGSLAVTLGFVGSAPSVAWTMDADVCMTGSAQFKAY